MSASGLSICPNELRLWVDQRPSVAYVDQHVSPAGSNAASSVPQTLPAGAMPARATLRT